MTKPLRVGITGGIAAGKSTVASMLRQEGAAVVDADQIAYELVTPGSEVLRRVEEAFGADVVDGHGRLLREKLGRIVFADVASRQQLESIMHPAIIEEANRRIDEMGQQGHAVVFYEAALLVETGRYREMDRLVVVIADDEVRIERLISRSLLSRQEAQRRLSAQLPQENKERLADYVIDNSGTFEETRSQVERIWALIQQEQQ